MNDFNGKYSILSYTHSDPLFESLIKKIRVNRDDPRKNLESVMDGRVNASVISLYAYFRHAGDLERIHATNIHTFSTTGSTILVSDGHTMKKSMNISISNETETTKEYLRLVLDALKINYTMVESQEKNADNLLGESEYALVIGDEALKVYGSKFRILMDVGYEFSRLYHMGPVYAVTVKRRDSDITLPDLHDYVRPTLNTINECTVKASKRLSIPLEIMAWYYGLIRYDDNKWVDSTLSMIESIFLKERG